MGCPDDASRTRDAFASLVLLEDRKLDPEIKEAAELLATVVGQDLEQLEDGSYRIARRVAKDRVISTVDTDARHGHKSSSRGFDGYKGHIAEDPDSEIITDTTVTPGNAGDASVATDIIEDIVDPDQPEDDLDREDQAESCKEPEKESEGDENDCPKVYGDAAYGTGEFLEHLDKNGIGSVCKTQPPNNRGGFFTKDRFQIDLEAQTVTCPAGVTVPIVMASKDGKARFGSNCKNCILKPECTNAKEGRVVRVGPHEKHLESARTKQQDPDWAEDYQATRPKVERKIGHLVRRLHGGRRARVRGRTKVDADFNLLAAACNLARLAVLGIKWTAAGWTAEAAK